MKKFISKFHNDNEEKMNFKLINRDFEEDLAEFIVEVFKFLEVIPSVKFLGWSLQNDESEIPYYKYITSRRKTKKKDKKIKYHYIKPDRAQQLTMKFMITDKDQYKIITKSILIPKFDDENYIYLKGNRYFLVYQLVDSSTYVIKNGIALKSLMPIIIMYRPKKTQMIDRTGKEYYLVTYFMRVFKRDIPLMRFFFCRLGVRDTLRYFTIDKIIRIVDPSTEVNDEKWIVFEINKNINMCVHRSQFNRFDSVRALVGMIFECFDEDKKIRAEDLDDKNYWLEQLGSMYTSTKHKKIESGRSTMLFFERLLDLTTKKKLKINEINKVSIYAIIKWLTLDFINLRHKNNMDTQNKRLRLKEYIQSMLNLKLGDSINRVLAYGNKASLRQIETNLFKFPNTIIMSILSASPLVKYDDIVNDCDFISSLKYTVKGPNSLGSGKNESNIGVKYRGTDVSYLGYIDINVYSSSSPGLNGSLTPFAHTKGLYFNDKLEPQNEEYNIYKDIKKELEDEGKLCVSIGKDDDPESYYDAMMKMKNLCHDEIKVVSKRDPETLYIDLDDDTDNRMI